MRPAACLGVHLTLLSLRFRGTVPSVPARACLLSTPTTLRVPCARRASLALLALPPPPPPPPPHPPEHVLPCYPKLTHLCPLQAAILSGPAARAAPDKVQHVHAASGPAAARRRLVLLLCCGARCTALPFVVSLHLYIALCGHSHPNVQFHTALLL